ncbi:MAG: hypothetical protein PVJ40_00845 [Gammaproteobacteria bacterium]
MQDSGLADIVRQASAFDALTRTVAAGLSDDTARHLCGAVCHGPELTLFFDSAPWASRARYEADFVSRSVEHATGRVVQRIRNRVMPSVGKNAEKPAPSRHISDDNRRLLSQCADAVSDPDLAGALRRLSGNRHRD